MKSTCFPPKFIDDIGAIDPEANYFTPVWNSLARSNIKIDKLLDVGCGNGVFTAPAKKLTGCKIYGVDGSEYAIEQARSAGFERLDLITDFNSSALPYENAEFDFCLCKDLLEHLLHPEFVLGEIRRVLRDDGRLLLHVPNHFPLLGRFKFLFTNDIDTFGYFPGAKRWDFPHIRFFTRESLLEVAESAGFRLLEDFSHHFPAIPMLGHLPLPAKLKRRLVAANPTQFAEGFTLLLSCRAQRD